MSVSTIKLLKFHNTFYLLANVFTYILCAVVIFRLFRSIQHYGITVIPARLNGNSGNIALPKIVRNKRRKFCNLPDWSRLKNQRSVVRQIKAENPSNFLPNVHTTFWNNRRINCDKSSLEIYFYTKLNR